MNFIEFGNITLKANVVLTVWRPIKLDFDTLWFRAALFPLSDNSPGVTIVLGDSGTSG